MSFSTKQHVFIKVIARRHFSSAGTSSQIVSAASRKYKNPFLVKSSNGTILSKARGQHLLQNESIIDNIISTAELRKTDNVFEVGPGSGALTLRILAKDVKHLTAVDVDEDMLRQVRFNAETHGYTVGSQDLSESNYSSDVFPDDSTSVSNSTSRNVDDQSSEANNLTLIQSCALKASCFPKDFDVLVSNLPYGISSKFVVLLMKDLIKRHERSLQSIETRRGRKNANNINTKNATSESSPLWRSATLMFQKEFAERLLAAPGEPSFSRLSVTTRFLVSVERAMDVKAGSFMPRPHVNSSVVKIVPRRDRMIMIESGIDKDDREENRQYIAKHYNQFFFAEFSAFLKILFTRRRRNVGASLTQKHIVKEISDRYKENAVALGKKPKIIDWNAKIINCVGPLKLYAAYVLDVDPLVQLLGRFHDEGIYFTKVKETRTT